jgi:ABC-type transport system substrate-binding protein
MNKKFGAILLILFSTLIVFAFQPTGLANDEIQASSVDIHGPYVNKIIFDIITVEETAILALEAGEIDIYNERVPAELVGRLICQPNIVVNKTMGTVFRHVSFNCEKFPFNYSAVRQAIAYGVDKWKIVQEATQGLALVADTPVPPVYGLYSIEEQFPVHYYDPLPLLGNSTLAAAGFVDSDGDGWREGPHGEEILIEIDVTDYPPAMSTCYVIEEGAESLGLLTQVNVIEWELLQTRFETGVFHATCFSWVLGVPDPDHLHDLWSTGELYNELICRFSNSTYDAAADDLLAATNIDDAVAAAATCQEIFWWEQPLIVAYVDSLTHSYRTDMWEDWQIFKGRGYTESEWCFYKVRLTEEAGGPLGGTLTVGQPELLESPNILTTNDGYTVDVFDLVYQPMYEIDPLNWGDITGKGLAESWTIESTTDPEGIKVTFDLIQNATWHDGLPVTSADVKFTIDVIQHNEAPWLIDSSRGIYNVETPDPYTVVVYSNRSGLFEFHRIGTTLSWILPKHIWEPYYDDVLTWVPEIEDLVGSGPFEFTDWMVGEFIELTAYDQWPYRPIPTTALTVTVSPDSVSEGDNFGVSAVLANTGIVPFTDVDVTVTLPSGTSLAAGTATVTLPRIGPGDSQTVTWVVTGFEAGTYSVSVAVASDQINASGTGSIEVVSYLIWYVAAIAIVAIVIIGGYFLLRR